MQRSPFGRDVWGWCARSIYVHYPGYFVVIRRLFPTSSDGTCKACPLGKPAVAAKPSKTDQGEFAKTASGCQSASQMGDFRSPLKLSESFQNQQRPVRCLCRQGSLSWLTSNLQQPMRNHRHLFRQGSLNKHATLVNTLSSPTASSWPPKKRQSARAFTRLQARTLRA